MTEEIKKLIELRINAGVIDNRSNYALFNEGMRKGSEIAKEIILSKWQEAERWRKVSEELPKWEGKEFTLITKKIGEYGTIYNIFPIRSEKSILFMKDLADEWKPIS